MCKKAKEAALKAYPVEMTPLVYQDLIDLFGGKTEIDVNTYSRCLFQEGYEQAERDLAKAILAEYKKQSDLCPDADYDHDYTIAETQQCGRFMMMEDLYEKFCEPVGVTLDDLEDEQ